MIVFLCLSVNEFTIEESPESDIATINDVNNQSDSLVNVFNEACHFLIRLI